MADYSSLLALIPAAAQAGTGIAQSIKGNRMGRGLTDPIYDIPQSAKDALELARIQASGFQPAGYDAFKNQLGQISAATQTGIKRGATSAPQALGATLSAAGKQIDALTDYQGFAERDYQQRQQRLVDALSRMSGYEANKWQNDILDPFLRKSTAASSLAGAGMQNVYAGLSDAAGVYANKQAAKEERAYQDKREAEKWERYKSLFNTSSMVPSLGTDSAPSTISPEAQKALDDYLKGAFDQYGDAFSSGTAPTDYTPNSNQSEFYTPQ